MSIVHGTVEVLLHCSTAGQAEKAVRRHNQKPAQWLGLALKGVVKKLLNTLQYNQEDGG